MKNNLKLRKCDICGKENHELFLTVRLKGRFSELPELTSKEMHLVKCDCCGMIYINWSVREDLIEASYSTEYFSTMGRRADNFYRLQIAREFLLRKGQKGKILEVGCGDGSFLHLMKKHGWNTYGLDVSSAAVKLAADKVGHELIFKGRLREVSFQSRSFDAICLRHVLEHLEKPLEDLNEIKRILTNNGLLCIVVPNIESLSFSIFGKNWFHLDVPRHSHHYSLSTLKSIATRAGFDLKKVAASPEDPLDWLRSLCLSLRINPFFPRFLLPSTLTVAAMTAPLTFLLSKLNRGTAIQCYFEKRL